jgi:hypothetical protein
MSISFASTTIEKWLLTGEAVHKNLSVGGGGLVQIPVPEGKTFIITGIEMLPFANIITDDNLFTSQNVLQVPEGGDITKILERIQFQLLFYGLNTNSVYNIRNKFVINNVYDQTNTISPPYITQPGISFEKHSFETFHVVENNCWLYLKYFNFIDNIAIATTDNFLLGFLGDQNWPPTDFYGYENQSDIFGYDFPAPAPAGFDYSNKGANFISPNLNTQFIIPNYTLAADPNQYSSFIPPYPDQANTAITAGSLPSIPFYNISVIEVNRRLSTKGLL